MAHGSFFKGEKKKKKRAGDNPLNFTPTFKPPEIIKKGKIKY